MTHHSPSLLCIYAAPTATDEMKPPIREGLLYPAKQLLKCPCGETFVDVGYRLDPDLHHITCNCGKKYYDGIWWLDLKRFRQPDQPHVQQLQITFTETVTRSVTVKFG